MDDDLMSIAQVDVGAKQNESTEVEVEPSTMRRQSNRADQ